MESARSEVVMRRIIVDESNPSEGAANPPSNEPELHVDEPLGSVSRWIADFKAGDALAFQPLWDRYYAMLVERARAKLGALRSSTAAHDEEDLASSAFQLLYDGVRAGRFPRLDDRDDLWRLLVHLTACKAVDRHRAENRQKRAGGKIVRETDLIAAGDGTSDAGNPLDRIIGAEPSPEFCRDAGRGVRPPARRAGRRNPAPDRRTETGVLQQRGNPPAARLLASHRDAEARADPEEMADG